MADRKFEAKPAKKESVPLLVGVGGASGCGKTYSALRLATGMQRVTGGDIYVIDTESRRALWYADLFTFKHLDFRAPYSSLDYLEAIRFCVKEGAKIVITDSMSHEHEGPGGILEWHEAELDRMAGNDWKKREKCTMAAWVKPKQARRKLLNEVVQLGVNGIFCFRAKDKIQIPKPGSANKEFVELGWMPIAGPEFVYEMTVQFLLYPKSDGVPTWGSALKGERMMTKLPAQFQKLLKDPKPLSEDIGEELARLASARKKSQPKPKEEPKPDPKADEDAPSAQEYTDLLFEIQSAESVSALSELARNQRTRPWTQSQREDIKKAISLRNKDLKEREGSE